jgi:hypothetical protein
MPALLEGWKHDACKEPYNKYICPIYASEHEVRVHSLVSDSADIMGKSDLFALMLLDEFCTTPSDLSRCCHIFLTLKSCAKIGGVQLFWGILMAF